MENANELIYYIKSVKNSKIKIYKTIFLSIEFANLLNLRSDHCKVLPSFNLKY